MAARKTAKKKTASKNHVRDDPEVPGRNESDAEYLERCFADTRAAMEDVLPDGDVKTRALRRLRTAETDCFDPQHQTDETEA